jgi:hypothetical protein
VRWTIEFNPIFIDFASIFYEDVCLSGFYYAIFISDFPAVIYARYLGEDGPFLIFLQKITKETKRWLCLFGWGILRDNECRKEE